MNHIKTKNGWSLYLETRSVDHDLYMVRLLTKFDQSMKPDELREINRLFFHKNEIEKIISQLHNLINI